MIRFPCGKCGREFAVDNSFAGQTGSCSWCGAAMTVPQPYADGTKTDELRDPEWAPTSMPDDEPNPFQLPQYRNQSNLQASRTSSYGGYQTWVIVAVVLLVLRIVLALMRER